MRSLVTSIFLYACESWTLTAPKKNTSHGNEVLPQDTTHLIQRPCCQRGSPCQDAAGNWTTRRPPDDHKETQTAVVWSCFPFIRSGQNHLARHSEQEEEELAKLVEHLDKASTAYGMEISAEKTKLMTIPVASTQRSK